MTKRSVRQGPRTLVGGVLLESEKSAYMMGPDMKLDRGACATTRNSDAAVALEISLAYSNAYQAGELIGLVAMRL